MVTWRYVPFQFYDPYVKTGLNKAVLEGINAGNEPVVWLSGWDRDCVNVGKDQRVSEVVDENVAEERNVAIVRRQGGGGAVFLKNDGEITWGVAGQIKQLKDTGMLDKRFEEGDDIGDAYKPICQAVVSAVKRLGIEARHKPNSNDVVTDDGKITGATGINNGDAVYLGGTLIYQTDPKLMSELLIPEKGESETVARHEAEVSSVAAESDATFDEAVQALKETLLEGRAYSETEWDDEEWSRAEELAKTYQSEDWIYRFDA